MKSMKSNWLRVWAVIPDTWPLWTCSLQRTVEDLEAVRDRPAARSCAPRSELLVEEGTKVPVGTVVATIVNGAAPQEPAPAVSPAHHVRVPPIARRMAAELGVDAEALDGTGPHGSPAGSCPRRCC